MSYESKKSHATYSRKPQEYPTSHMSPHRVDFDFRKSNDLGGHIFLIHVFAKNP